MFPTRVNIANADDHVPEVERSIRTIKERVRAVIHALPFQRVPKLMIKSIADKVVRSLNQFPAPNGISDALSPLTIMTGKPNVDYGTLQLEFGTYAQVFEANNPTNTTRARTTGAIALHPTGNEQGGFYFLSLTTGKRLSRLQWQELPMPDEVIERVETMAEVEGQPRMANGMPLFEWAPGIEAIDDNDVDIIDNEDEELEPGAPQERPLEYASDADSIASDAEDESIPPEDMDNIQPEPRRTTGGNPSSKRVRQHHRR